MDEFELFPGEPGGPIGQLEGFSAMPPDQQEQVRRYYRTQYAATQMAAQQDAMRFQGDIGQIATKAGVVANEFARNYTGGLGDYAGAAVSYLTEALPGRQPMEGLGFTERRDALRGMHDIRAGLIPKWLDDAASLAGVVSVGTGPRSAPINTLPQAVKYGAAVGGAEALGTSEGQTAGEIATDAGVGAALGAGAGAAADVILDPVLGGAARRMFAKRAPGASAAAYEAQRALGIPPSAGSVGNDLAAVIENSLANSPVAPVSAVLPGTSALERQAGQRQLVDTALRREITDPMRPSWAVPAETDADLAYSAQELARNTSNRLGLEVDQMENAYSRLVPPQTPVNVQQTREFPTVLRREGRGENLATRADANLEQINRNQNYPVDPTLHGQLMSQKTTYERNIQQAEQQLAKLADKPRSGTQRSNLRRTIDTNKKRLADTEKKIYDNMGPGFQALRDERGDIGKATVQGGLMGGQVAGRLYDTVTNDLAAAANRVRPGAGDEFLAMTSREKDIFADKKILARYEGGNTSSNFPALRSAVLKGNWEDLDVLLSKATPDETVVFQADLIDMLGRPTGAKNPNQFDAGTFAGNWAKMPDAAKQRLFDGNPEGLAVADTLAEVAKDFQERAGMRNTSNTAAASGLMAFLGAAVASPSKLAAFLAVTTGLDRAVVSDTLARAVAGERAPLGDMIRKAAIAYAGTGDQNMEFGPQ